MRYLEVAVRCRRAAAEPVADRLGALAGGGAAIEDPLEVLLARAEGRWDMDGLGDPGDPEWVTVKAYLAEAGTPAAGPGEGAARVAAALDDLRRLDVGEIGAPAYRWVADEDWAGAWKQFFKPLAVGRRLVIVPSWEAADYTPPAGRIPLLLDPGMAFGTGQHATTALCLCWLEELPLAGARVLDVGTGSGVLAIAAARLGAAAVLGVDIDPVAVAAAGDNVAANGVAGTVQVALGDPSGAAAAAFCAADRPAVVVGNLTADVVKAVAPAVADLLAPGGCFVASGIITDREAEVRDALAAAGLRTEEVRVEGGWAAVLARPA